MLVGEGELANSARRMLLLLGDNEGVDVGDDGAIVGTTVGDGRVAGTHAVWSEFEVSSRLHATQASSLP